MPWSDEDPPSVAKNWTSEEKHKCVTAANAVLADGGSDQDAIFACIAAAGKSKQGEKTMSNLYVRAFYERKDEAAEAEGGRCGSRRARRGGQGWSGDQRRGWKLENYRKNPVVLWAHDYLGKNLPIGKAVNVTVDGKRLVADVVFDPADELARQVERKYRTGI